jgi:NAD(P)-dependent dehydrogenase (short-subunit alcohol dehydrogenase family)
MIAATPRVTGANKGIGFENGRQVGRAGALVLLGASAAKLSLALPPARRHLIWQFLEVNA